ncbi:RNA polymerase-binding protein DksA [bacterium]|nr:RNA polymerase-binding protein DksA [candidate division CSSED10-310 bacterium]
MKKKQLEYFENKLMEWKKTLLKEAGDSLNINLSQENSRQGDFGDLANNETDQNFELRIRDRERKLIQKIDACLQKVKDGTYGLCEECGEEISLKRLDVRPVASLCIACKTEQEKHER